MRRGGRPIWLVPYFMRQVWGLQWEVLVIHCNRFPYCTLDILFSRFTCIRHYTKLSPYCVISSTLCMVSAHILDTIPHYIGSYSPGNMISLKLPTMLHTATYCFLCPGNYLFYRQLFIQIPNKFPEIHTRCNTPSRTHTRHPILSVYSTPKTAT